MGADGIVTPEAVVLDFEPAGVASRLTARVVDVFIQLAAVTTLANVLVGVAATGGETAAVIGSLVLGFVAVFAYPAVLEALNHGRTPGKSVVGLRVVTIEGAPVRLRHTAVRSMMQVIDILLTFGGAAVVSSVLSRRGQRLGDVLAGTLVVRERRASGLLSERAVRFPNPAGLDDLVRSIDPTPLRPDQAALLRGFLIRVTELEPAARASLAARIAPRVSGQIGQPVPAGLHPETWLASVAAARQRRSEKQVDAVGPPVRPGAPAGPRSSLPAPPPPPRPRRPAGPQPGPGWTPPS